MVMGRATFCNKKFSKSYIMKDYKLLQLLWDDPDSEFQLSSIRYRVFADWENVIFQITKVKIS